MVSKKLIIDLLNGDNKEYQRYRKLYETTKDFKDKMLYWDRIFAVSVSLNARKQMCTAFGYDIVYDENGNITDIKER